jgi:hypothetical protein
MAATGTPWSRANWASVDLFLTTTRSKWSGCLSCWAPNPKLARIAGDGAGRQKARDVELRFGIQMGGERPVVAGPGLAHLRPDVPGAGIVRGQRQIPVPEGTIEITQMDRGRTGGTE